MLGKMARVSVVLVGLVAAVASSTKKTPEEEAKQAAEEAKEAAKKEADRREVATGSAAVEVTAGKLYVDYKTNEIGADATYRDKLLSVTGIIARLGKSSRDEPVIHFVANGGRDSIEATFATDVGLVDLKRSDTITARCRGKKDHDTPKLVDCIFEKMVDHADNCRRLRDAVCEGDATCIAAFEKELVATGGSETVAERDDVCKFGLNDKSTVEAMKKNYRSPGSPGKK